MLLLRLLLLLMLLLMILLLLMLLELPVLLALLSATKAARESVVDLSWSVRRRCRRKSIARGMLLRRGRAAGDRVGACVERVRAR